MNAGRTFMVLQNGVARPSDIYMGLYHRDTRYVSLYELTIDGEAAVPVKSWKTTYSMHYVYESSRGMVARTISPLYDGVYDLIRGEEVELGMVIGMDFSDIFEVRDALGNNKKPRMRTIDISQGKRGVVASYIGMDGVKRALEIRSKPAPIIIDDKLKIKGRNRLSIRLLPTMGSSTLAIGVGGPYMEFLRIAPRIKSSNNAINSLYMNSLINIFTLLEAPPKSLFPLGGIPWFDCVFGRDSIITAMQALPLIPGIAETVIHRLSELIGRKYDTETEEEPGKIIHERREGEISGSILPFRKYYGTIDATPLYLVLVAKYAKQMGVFTIDSVRNSIEMAVQWLLNKLSNDKLGLLGYGKGALSNQGWKDSWDSVFDSDGELLGYPRYLVEVQGYTWEALHLINEVMPHLKLGEAADNVKSKLGLFWSQRLGYFSEAIDGEGRSADIYTSNPGHLLWSHAVSKGDAEKIANALMNEKSLFTEYGIKTLGFDQPRHDPNSYHNGSIWPHDNSIILRGLADYGLCSEFSRAAAALLNAYRALALPGLPELYSGSPPPRPMGNFPQSWSSGAVFMIIQGILGISVNDGGVTLKPCVPEWLDWIEVKNMRLLGSQFSVRIMRRGGDVEIIQGSPARRLEIHIIS